MGNSDENEEKSRGQDANLLTRKKEVEVAHPWAEWIEFVVRLAQQNYFDPRRLSEEKVAKSVGIDLSGVKEEIGFDFSMDWTAVRNACTYFCKDRYDILRYEKDIWLDYCWFGVKVVLLNFACISLGQISKKLLF